MRCLVVFLGLVVATNSLIAYEYVSKCCGADEMLSGDGRKCIRAYWAKRNSSRANNRSSRALPLAKPFNFTLLEIDIRRSRFPRQSGDSILRPPFERQWLARWLPPGMNTKRISEISLHFLKKDEYPQPVVIPVNSSGEWEIYRNLNKSFWEGRVVFGFLQTIYRPKSVAGGFREIDLSCVDATPSPLGKFALMIRKWCVFGDCIRKCCGSGYALAVKDGAWECVQDRKGYWSPFNSTFTKYIDVETPFLLEVFDRKFLNGPLSCAPGKPRAARLLPGDKRSANLINRFFFKFDIVFGPCVDFERKDNSSVQETLLFCEDSVSKGMYRTVQPLSLISMCLLVAALAAIATNNRMRNSVHGWALGCHAACLLVFNLGQALYYLTISDDVDAAIGIPSHLWGTCQFVGFTMYFLLTAAAAWLNAVCINMAIGFSCTKLKMASARDEERRRFLALSAFAWGLPVAMTAACVYFFYRDSFVTTFVYQEGGEEVELAQRSWYSPSLMETRCCFHELVALKQGDDWKVKSQKSGAGLFYFGPVCALIAVNVCCLATVLRKVSYLRRGKSVLRRDEDQPTSQHAEDPTGEGASSRRAPARARAKPGTRSSLDSRSILLYIKMLLMAGAVEMVTETVAWGLSTFHSTDAVVTPASKGYSSGYRATGYVADVFRATCVAWMAAPDGGYLVAMQKGLRGLSGSWGPAFRRKGKRKNRRR